MSPTLKGMMLGGMQQTKKKQTHSVWFHLPKT